MKHILMGFLATWWLAAAPARGGDTAKLDLADGDRVVLIGDALIERDQSHGYLETRITAANPDKTLVFRNLGWSGDTVFGAARAGFDTAAEGFQRIKEHVIALKPTVIVVGYGMSDSFSGDAGLPRFVGGLNTLLDALAETKARVVLLSPIAHEDLGRPLPDPASHNHALERYCDAIEKVARERRHLYVPLFDMRRPANEPLTDNGIHLTQYGYWLMAARVESKLWPDRRREQGAIALSRDGKLLENQDVEITEIQALEDGLRFKLAFKALPPPPPPPGSRRAPVLAAMSRALRVTGLPAGRYVLKIDDKPIAVHTAQEWENGAGWTSGPEFDQVEHLRQAIVEKNRLYFYRWRPQNETYLFGFRKHEQGQNAREIPQFDPLVAEQETSIARLRVPVPHFYEVKHESEVAK